MKHAIMALPVAAILSLQALTPVAHAEEDNVCDTSVNGMPIIEFDNTESWQVAGITFWTAPGEATEMLSDFTQWFHDNIEPINAETEAETGDDWSWAASEPINGPGTPCSNHGSGSAIDLNAEKHQMHDWNTFSLEQTIKIRTKLLEYDGKIQWGGNWTDPRDEMHFEYVPDGRQTDSFMWVDEIVPGSSTSSMSSELY